MREILFDTSFLGYPMYPKRTLDTLQFTRLETKLTELIYYEMARFCLTLGFCKKKKKKKEPTYCLCH